jgi:hypothetical protein
VVPVSTQHSLLILLGCLVLIGLATGCSCSPTPAPPPTASNQEVEEAVAKSLEELGKQVEATDKDLKQKAVSFLIDGVRDNEHERELFTKVQQLEDAGAKSNSVLSGAGYYQKDNYFRISPISDIEAAAAKIDFGRVLALDPANRIILLDASAEPAPRPAQGWPGAKTLDEYVIRKTMSWAAMQAEAGLIKKFGREKVIVVYLPEAVQDTPGVSPSPEKHPLILKLRELAPETLASTFPGFGPQGKHFVVATVAPVEKLDDAVQALGGAALLGADEQQRVILVGDLADLKPPAAESKEPAPMK